MRALAVVGLVLVARAPEAHAGACAKGGLAPEAMTHAADAIPKDGGVLVGAKQAFADDTASGEDPASGSLVFVQGKQQDVVKPTPIAPGLAVYAPKLTGKLELQTAKGVALGAFETGDQPAFAVPAPALRGVRVYTFDSERDSTQHAQADLAATPPADAVAVVIYDVGADPDVPLSWSRVAAGPLQVPVFSSGGRCTTMIPGTQQPYPQQEVAIAWVDRFGRRSALSEPVEVTNLGTVTAQPAPLPPVGQAAAPDAGAAKPAKPAAKGGCGCGTGSEDLGGGAVLLGLALLIMIQRQR